MLSLERRLFAPVPAVRHQLLVAALAVVMGVRLATSRYGSLADLPDSMFVPPWFLDWFDGPPPAGVLVGLQVLGVVSAAVVVATRGRRTAPFVATWLSLLVLGGVQTSAGKILHNDVLVLLAAVPFLLPPIPSDTPGYVAGWHRRVAMVVVATGYAASGWMKLRHSGLAWVTSDNLRWVLYSGARRPQTPWPELGRFVADRAWMATGLAAATIVLEIAFPLALLRRLRPWFVAGVVGLHVGVFLTLGLDYWTWVATVVVVFTPWWRRFEGRGGTTVQMTNRRDIVTTL